MVLPIFLGKTINSINIIIDKSIASLLSEGVVSVLNYGNRITGFVTSVFVVSITTALFPQLSRLSAASDTRQLKHTYRSSCGIIGLFVIPCFSAGSLPNLMCSAPGRLCFSTRWGCSFTASRK